VDVSGGADHREEGVIQLQLGCSYLDKQHWKRRYHHDHQSYLLEVFSDKFNLELQDHDVSSIAPDL
jgi:hypothetical protein